MTNTLTTRPSTQGPSSRRSDPSNTDTPWRVFGNRRFIPPTPPLGSGGEEH